MFRSLFPRRFNARSSLLELAADTWAIAPCQVEAGLGEIYDHRLHTFFKTVASCVVGADIHALRAAELAASDDAIIQVEDGVAHIAIDGMLVSRGGPFLRAFGLAATDYGEIDDALVRAKKKDIDRVVLHVTSPGGAVTGLQATANRIHDLRKKKPIRVQARGEVCSAAYWLASQGTPGEFVAEEGTEVGSIGVYATVEDHSKLFENAGIKVHVRRAGPHKGQAVHGAQVAEEHLDRVQVKLDRHREDFLAAVARGRDLKPSDVPATGETWTAADALDQRLIDGIEDFDADTIPEDAPLEGATSQEAGEDMDLKDIQASVEALTKARAEDLKKIDAQAAELATLKADNKKALDEQSAKQSGEIESLRAQAKAESLNKAITEARVLPAEREAYEALAKTMEPEAYAAHLGKLQPRSTKEGAGRTLATGTEKPEEIDLKGQKIRRILGVTGEESVFRNAKAMLANGTFVGQDGNVLELKKKGEV